MKSIKKRMISFVCAMLAVGACATSNDDLTKISPIAIKKVNFRIEGDKLLMVSQMVFLNEGDQTVLLKDATFNMRMKAENKIAAKLPCIGFECRCKECTPGSDKNIPDLVVDFGEGTRSLGEAGKRSPMVLPKGPSLHCIETVFASGLTTEEAKMAALLDVVRLNNVFADPDYNVVMVMNGDADIGRYRRAEQPNSGSVYTSKLEFIDLQMQATRGGGVPTEGKSWATHQVMIDFGPQIKKLGHLLFNVY